MKIKTFVHGVDIAGNHEVDEFINEWLAEHVREVVSHTTVYTVNDNGGKKVVNTFVYIPKAGKPTDEGW